MPAEFDIRPVVEKYSALPVERLRILRSCDGLQLSQMQRGIVFVFAAWSGPAVFGFRKFSMAIKPFATQCLDIVVLDIDCLTGELAPKLFGTPSFTTGGWGETIWVRNGDVVARLLAHDAPEALIEQHTKKLFE